MGYVEMRDPVLVHVKAAALAVNPKWTDVATGLPRFGSSKGARVFYGGETEPVIVGRSVGNRSLNSELVAQRVGGIAWWSLSSLSDATAAAIENEAAAFVHELRTRLDGDQTLGGAAQALSMDYAEPDIVVAGGTRFLVIEWTVTADCIEYQTS